MAHIADGILSAPILATGAAIGLAGLAIGLKRLEPERIPQVAVLSGLFFVAALVHFPVGPSSVHLILNGLVGITLGWAAFPAIFVALLLQAVLFGFGGLLVLGVNLTNLAVPAILCGLIFRAVTATRPGLAVPAAGLAGALGVALSMGALALSLAASGREFLVAAELAFVTHLPVMAIEAAFTAAAIGLLAKVRPGFLSRGALAGLVLAAGLAAAPPAFAHKLKLFATAAGDQITGQAYFVGGDLAQGVTVIVSDSGGNRLASIVTDAQGAFSFTMKNPADLVLSIEGDDGHAASFALSGRDAGPAATPDLQLQSQIDAALARQLAPLRAQLDATMNKIWMHDVIGGLGAIFGLFGVAYGLSARRRNPS